METKCFKCGKSLTLSLNSTLGRGDHCPSCSADLRCCKMCHFYDVKAYNECKEPIADRITDKEKANFCDYFKIGTPQNDAEKQRQEMLAKAAALFKK